MHAIGHGTLGYFGLWSWWLATFSDAERKHIQTVFQPVGSSDGSLTSGTVSSTSQTPVGLLTGLASWFRTPSDHSISHRLLEKAAELADTASILDVHFMLQQVIVSCYRNREEPGCIERVIDACERQIGIAPAAAAAFRSSGDAAPLPAHKGYEQLAIILEKSGRWHEAIQLADRADSQGWMGSWNSRIARCQRKIARASAT